MTSNSHLIMVPLTFHAEYNMMTQSFYYYMNISTTRHFIER